MKQAQNGHKNFQIPNQNQISPYRTATTTGPTDSTPPTSATTPPTATATARTEKSRITVKQSSILCEKDSNSGHLSKNLSSTFAPLLISYFNGYHNFFAQEYSVIFFTSLESLQPRNYDFIYEFKRSANLIMDSQPRNGPPSNHWITLSDIAATVVITSQFYQG